MNAIASTTAWALHDLGLATTLGGVLYGRTAMHPAVKEVSDPKERGELIRSAWQRFNTINLVSHLAFGATWLIGRATINGRSIGKNTRNLVYVKDGLVITALVSGLISMAAGAFGIKEPSGDAPRTDDEGHVSAGASRQAKVAEIVTGVSGILNFAAVAATIGVTAVLAMSAGRSTKWSLLSRLLP
jgi:hypothetical protein